MSAPLRQQLYAESAWYRSVALTRIVDECAHDTRLAASALLAADTPADVRTCIATLNRIASRLRDALGEG